MKKTLIVVSSIVLLLSLASCRNYIYIPVPITPSTPTVSVSEEQVIQAEQEAEKAFDKLNTAVPTLPGTGGWDESDTSFEYEENDKGEVTARYGSFESMFGIDEFISTGTVNEPISTVQLLGNTYTIDDTDDISVGMSNFVRDSIFKVENGTLKINMFYFYATLLFDKGIYVNGTRLDEYDGLFNGDYTDVDLTETGPSGLEAMFDTGTGNASIEKIADNEFNITYEIPKNGTSTPRYKFWQPAAGDIEFVNNSVIGISFDIYDEEDEKGRAGAYPFGWTPDAEDLVNSSRTEQIEYMVMHSDGTITHYEFTLHFILEYAE